MAEIGILGAGAFGTALGVALALGGRQVALWGRDTARQRAIEAARENRAHLPGIALPDTLRAVTEPPQAPVTLLAVPTQALRASLSEVRPRGMLVLCCKGVEHGTGLLPSQVVQDVLPGSAFAVLTGPSFAVDIAAGKPTALTLAATGGDAPDLQGMLATPTLRPYLTDDMIGAQLGGALKNVVAIAAGVVMGAGLGESARASVMTRGFAEMGRLAQRRGARPETLSGLSGFGDLVLTCTSAQSRNYGHGLALGAGRPPAPGITVEGVMTAHALAADPQAGDMPIASMVSALLAGRVSLAQAQAQLMARPLRREAGAD